MAGYAAAAQSSAVVIPHLGWRWLFGLGAIPLLMLPLVALLLPESPRWLARLGRIADANRALAKLGGGPLPVETTGAVPANMPPSAVAPTRMTALFAPDYRKRTIIIICLWFFTSFATFGLTTWVPSIYVREFKIPVTDALAYAAISSTLYLFASPIVAVIMDYTGRRPLGLAGTFIAAAALLSLSVHIPESRFVLIGLVVTGALSISIGSLIVWPYTAETYPTRLRAVGLGMASATARGASMLTPLIVGGILGESGSVRVVFGVVGACALVAFILWLTATRETARMSLDDLK
jgi:putative MFS transporter